MAFYGPKIDIPCQRFRRSRNICGCTAQGHGPSCPQALAPRGIYVGEVVVNGFVKGSEGAAQHDTTVEPKDIADQFWNL